MVVGLINYLKIPPIQAAAAGALIGFYVLFRMHFLFVIIFLSLIFISFNLFFVLASLNTASRRLHLISIYSIVITAGIFAGLFAAYEGRSNVYFSIPENSVTGIEGRLLDDPRIVSGGNMIAVVSMYTASGKDGLRVSSRGEVSVFFSQENAQKIREFGRGTVIYIEGIPGYSGYGWSVNAQSVHIVKPASVIEQKRTSIRLSLINRFSKEDFGGMSLILLLGIRDNLDSSLLSLYREAGLSYILALSGMHLAIFAALISFVLRKPLGLKGCAIAGSVFIFLYCLLTGPMPSLYRAAFMYFLGVAAIIGGFPKKTMSILSVSFLFQLIITPAAGNSISFILSYLALAGILLTGFSLSSLLAGKIPDFLLQPLSISAGAFLATAGVCSFVFGMIAPMGIITSLVIVPLTAVFMTGSILWLLFDFFSISAFLNPLLSFLYWIMEKITSLAGIIPGISVNPYLILIFSLGLSLWIIIMEYNRRMKLLKLQLFD
ncbi:MAG: ComEC/Rec2 family competence protein [Treponema sp.]|nr:ComEC/Rec2 family competence protein [Treponema sp.]